MVKYYEEPIKMSAVEFSENGNNEGRVGLFDLKENLLYAIGDSEDWVELEEKKEAMKDGEFYVATGPIKKVVVNSLGWR